jgi:hypothetical protein
MHLPKLKQNLPKGAYMKKVRNNSAKDSGGGANVIVTTVSEWKGWGGDFVLITPHAELAGRYFKRIMSIAYSIGKINYFSKHQFFHDLAKAVADLPEIFDKYMVFNALITETLAILKLSMNTVESDIAKPTSNKQLKG